ncbi:DUF1801 domain-containing protein [Mycolicibacterium lutetiense]
MAESGGYARIRPHFRAQCPRSSGKAFSLDGLICTLEMYKGKVKVNFAKGSSLHDPDHLFNASLEAPVGRFIDLREGEAVDADAFRALIQDAVRVNRS